MNIDALRKAHPLIGELITAYDSFEKQHPGLSSGEWENVVLARIATLNEKLRTLGIVAAIHKPDAFLKDVPHTPYPGSTTLPVPETPPGYSGSSSYPYPRSTTTFPSSSEQSNVHPKS